MFSLKGVPTSRKKKKKQVINIKIERWEWTGEREWRASVTGSSRRLDFTIQPIYFRSAVSQAPDCYFKKFGWSHLPWLSEWQNQGSQGLGRFRVTTCLGLSMDEGVSGGGAVRAKTQIGCPGVPLNFYICGFYMWDEISCSNRHPGPSLPMATVLFYFALLLNDL